MNGRLTARGPKEAGRPPKQWEDSLQENLRALGAVPRKGAQRKWFVYDVEVNGAYDWVTAAKNMGRWHLGVEQGAQEHEDAWRCADKRESDRRHRREAAAPRGSPTEGLHLLVSGVDCLRGGSPAKSSGVRLYCLRCPDSLLLCLSFPAFFFSSPSSLFFFFRSEYI